MHARLVTALGRSSELDEMTKLWHESVLPAARRQAGFKGALVLADPETGKAVSVTLWDTRDDMLAGEASGYYQEQLAKAAPLLTGEPVREHFEVILSEVPSLSVTT